MTSVKLAIKDEHKDHPFPVIKKNIRATKPPEIGKGLRLATYQGPLMCGDKKAIDFNLSKLEEWAAKAAGEGMCLYKMNIYFSANAIAQTALYFYRRPDLGCG